MDDAWLHSFTSAPAPSQEEPRHKRRTSLLQQPVEAKADVAAEALPEHEEHSAWSGPPHATVLRQAQSYSDFYDVVTSRAKREKVRKRQASFGSLETTGRREYTDVEFDEEFASLEDVLLDESHAVYQTYQEELELSHSHLQHLLSSARQTLGQLSLLSDSFKSVEVQTDAFRGQCESLVNDQKRLESLADDVDENARYYTFLEPMNRRLNAPGAANLVKGKDFPEILANLDSCLAYMEAHSQQKEAETYRSRYRLLLTRALTLVRHYFTKSLGDLAAEISKRIQSGQLKDTTRSTLLYAKFRVPAPELKALGLEIQKRAVPTPDDVDAGREPEYASLMRELYQSYSATRGRLILPLVSKKMVELASTPQQSDVLAFAKSSLNFTRGICLDEYDLWFEWFQTDGALYDFLESLIEPMYDYLRPRTIHETKLEKLCELCAMIQGRYMDMDSDDEDDDDVSSSAVSRGPHDKRATGKLDFAALVQPALEDAQTRLVFLAVNALRDGVERYKPKPEDLVWPKKVVGSKANGSQKDPVLSGKRETAPSKGEPKPPNATGETVQDGDSIISKQLASTDGSNSTQHWYPTLPKAIWLLRRIYRLVNSTVFDDLAHRIVHSTISSLLYASQQISSTNKSPQDGQLFLITHLLHLKQQIVAFDIEFIPPDVEFDFSSMTSTFYELRDRGSLWNPASWMRLVGGAVGGGLLPKVVENMLDAKAELDGRLRTAINDFVNAYATHITAPVEPSTVAKAKAKKEFDELKAVRTVRGLAEKEVPELRAKLQEAVEDGRTRETLVAAVRDQVVVGYEDFFDAWSEGQGRRVSRKGKGREDDVWEPGVFAEVVGRVFAVGPSLSGGEGEERWRSE